MYRNKGVFIIDRIFSRRPFRRFAWRRMHPWPSRIQRGHQLRQHLGERWHQRPSWETWSLRFGWPACRSRGRICSGLQFRKSSSFVFGRYRWGKRRVQRQRSQLKRALEFRTWSRILIEKLFFMNLPHPRRKERRKLDWSPRNKGLAVS